MLHKAGITQSLARLVVTTRWEDIPQPVRHQAKRSFMNFFATALTRINVEDMAKQAQALK